VKSPSLSNQRVLARRPRVLDRLSTAAAYPITLVIAPAGFGKTTAIKELLAQRAAPTIFVSTPESTTLEYFVHAFARVCSTYFPEMATPPNETNAGAQETDGTVQLMVAWACAHLRDVRCTVAVDDLQFADRDRSVAAFLARLADQTKEHISWIFSSRTRGNLPLTRWQAYGDADDPISAADLRMTLDEAISFAKALSSPATHEQLANWVALTEGFPVPLTYAIRLSSRRGTAEGIIDGTRAVAFRFLAEQIWDSLSEDERKLLEIAAFLPPLHMHEYEDAGIRNATALISQLCQNIAFLVLSPAGIFSIHDLFRDFVRRSISTMGPTEQRDRLDAAVKLLLSLGHYNDGFSLAIELGTARDVAQSTETFPSFTCDLAVTRSIVEVTEKLGLSELGLRLLELHTEHWLWIGNPKKSQRYAQEILKRPNSSSAQVLCAIRSTAKITNFQGPAAHRHWLATFPKMFSRLDEADRLQANAYQASLLARYPETQGEARSIIQAVLLELSKVSPKAHIDSLIAIACALYYLGDIEATLDINLEAAELAESLGDPRESARTLNNYGQALSYARDSKIESLFGRLRELVERTGSWRFSHVSHWLPAQYYALQANLSAANEARNLQSATFASETLERQRLSAIRLHCSNLCNLIAEDYDVIISNFSAIDLPTQNILEYELLTVVAAAFAFKSNTDECQRVLIRLKQIRSSLSADWIYWLRETVFLETIVMCMLGRWVQARQLNDQASGQIARFSQIERACALFCQGPPYLNVLAELDPCLNKPFVGLAALLMKRVVEREWTEPVKQHLTSAEMDVLRLIVVGKSNKEIATSRSRSEETIKRQAASLYRKLGVENRTSAVAVARERGII
jgi:DNA-binding CsgD family transcriptional regulator